MLDAIAVRPAADRCRDDLVRQNRRLDLEMTDLARQQAQRRAIEKRECASVRACNRGLGVKVGIGPKERAKVDLEQERGVLDPSIFFDNNRKSLAALRRLSFLRGRRLRVDLTRFLPWKPGS